MWSSDEASLEDDQLTIPPFDLLSPGMIWVIWINAPAGARLATAIRHLWQVPPRTLKTLSSLSLRFTGAMKVGEDRGRSPGSEDKFAEKRIRERTMGLPRWREKLSRRALSSTASLDCWTSFFSLLLNLFVSLDASSSNTSSGILKSLFHGTIFLSRFAATWLFFWYKFIRSATCKRTSFRTFWSSRNRGRCLPCIL